MLFVLTRVSLVNVELGSPFHRTGKLSGTRFPGRCVERESLECCDGTGGGCVRGGGGMSG